MITITRRRLLDWYLKTSAGMLLTSAFPPLVRYLTPPDVPDAEAARVVAGRPGDLKPNEGRVFAFGSRPAILVRTEEGEYRALSASCTHLNCTVQYRPDLKQLWCACHNGTYDLSGQNVSGPPPRPLTAYRVEVADGQVVVSKA